MDYINSESDFYKFLTDFDKVSKSTRTNYISYLRFLNKHYEINESISEFSISEIIKNEIIEKDNRDFYTKDKYISNFKSALNKYHKFINSNFTNDIILDEERKLSEIISNKTISITEKQNLTLSRIGQGKFRNQLIEYWDGCSVTNLKKVNLLTASHIKPWSKSNNIERLDLNNGLLLTPNYDKLFDKGYINFNNNGFIVISKYLNLKDQEILNIDPNSKIERLNNYHKEYLNYHFENCFIK